MVYGVCELNTVQPQTNTLATGLPPSSLQEQEYDYPLCALPPVYGSVEARDEKLINVSYATFTEREDELEKTIVIST